MRLWRSILTAGVLLAARCAAQAQVPAARLPLPSVRMNASADTQDLGRASIDTPIRRVQLVLTRTSAAETDLKTFLQQQQEPGAAAYRQWLTPAEFGARFGPADADLARLTAFLTAAGMTDVRVNAGRTVVEFSATAGSLNAAFGAEIHTYSNAPGSTFPANAGATTVPAGLAGVVAGIAGLGAPTATPQAQPQTLRRDNQTGAVSLAPQPGGARANYTVASNNTVYYGVTPYDFAAIYDVLPLWNASTPIDGTGQTIAVAGDTDINPADFVAFRQLFSLPLGNTATATGTQYLNIIYNGPKPAVLADEFHADSDTQWAAAAARGATIDYVASQATEASSGADLSAAYIVDNNLAPILVYSYSRCELALGTAGNAFYNALWQQAAAQGITVVTAAGDSGSAACDAAHVAPAKLGPAVNGIGSTPYDVSVGGTEFYAPNGVGQYFRQTNDANQASALGYIPETVWNDSCTNPAILATAPYAGLSAEAACNGTAAAAPGFAATTGSGGGASACTVSNGSDPNTCSGAYAKPAWQAGAGVPADGVRDVPDVALFASQGRTNSFYIVCQSSRDPDGKGCNLNFPYSDFAAYGGTEVAAPAFAGILALAAQKTALATGGGRMGNPNAILYKLAAQQQASGLACTSTTNPGAGCYFRDITTGTNAMPCVTGSPGCTTANAGDAYGVMTAYAAGAGYDRASGLGSVDAANLVSAFTSIQQTTTAAVLSINPPTITHGAGVSATVTVTGQPTPTGQVSLNSQAGNGSVGAGTLANGTLTQTFRDFPGGTYGVRAHYAGDSANAPTDSNFVSITVAPEPSTTTLRALAYNPNTGAATSLTSAPYGDIFYLRADIAGLSGQGIATGNVGLTDNGVILGSGVYRLNSSGYTEAQNNALTPGIHMLAASYSGDSSFNASTASPFTLTITRAQTTAAVTSSVATVSQAGIVTLSATIATESFGYAAPTGSVTFYSGTQLLGTSVLNAGSDPVTYFRNATATLTLSASPFPLGANALSVVYVGDANYLGATSPATPLTVTGTTLTVTTTAASASPATISLGGAITFYTAVTPVTAGGPAVGGTVQFIVDGQNIGAPIPLTNGLGGLTTNTTTYTVGTHTLLAVYSGDGTNYRSSASSGFLFTVASPTVVAVPSFTATPSTLVQGTFISVAGQVAPQIPAAGSPMPTGTLQLVLDGSPYGGAFPLVSGAVIVPLNTPTIQVGPHVLTVFYSGDNHYASSYALPATIVISAPGTTPSAVALSGLSSQVNLGSAAMFTATVTPASPTPTGIFEISFDGGNPGAPILLSGSVNQLTLPASLLTLGSHTVSVFYSGDATYNFSHSVTVSFNVVTPVPPVPPVQTGSFTLTPAQIEMTGNRLGAAPTQAYVLTPNGGFAGNVAMSCNNLPANTACVFSPASVALGGSASGNTLLTLQLNTGIKAENRVPFGLGALTLAGLLGLLWPRRNRGLQRLAALLLLAALAGAAGCGRGYSPGASPAGNYTVQVVATSGSTVQTSTINLTIH